MSRRKWFIPGCAIMLVLAVVVIIVSAPAALALRLAGFRAEGKTADFLNEQAADSQPTIQWSDESAASAPTTPTPAATPAPDGSGETSLPAVSPPDPDLVEPLDAVRVDIWFLSQPATFYPHEIYAQRLERGRTEDGALAYYIEFDEEGANAYLDHWFGVYVAQEARVRDPWIDLKPGGAVIYADVDLELGWQRVGAVFMLDNNGRQLVLVGVDVDGRLYSTPPAGRIAELAAQLESEGNRALRELTFLDSAGRLTIQAISLSEDGAQILAY